MVSFLLRSRGADDGASSEQPKARKAGAQSKCWPATTIRSIRGGLTHTDTCPRSHCLVSIGDARAPALLASKRSHASIAACVLAS